MATPKPSSITGIFNILKDFIVDLHLIDRPGPEGSQPISISDGLELAKLLPFSAVAMQRPIGQRY
jgi:hypothetical protein